MRQRTIRMAALVSLAVFAFALQACETTSHRVIQQGFQADGDRIKFLYEEIPSYERGIIECYVAEDGELYDCQDINIVFNIEED